jgi:opacity protein-like surface antigen
VYTAPPPAPAPVYFSWSGCYVGGHVGGVWTRKDWFVRDPAFPSFRESDGSHDADGFIGGVQGGCDYRFAVAGSSVLPATTLGPTPTAVISALCSPAS